MAALCGLIGLSALVPPTCRLCRLDRRRGAPDRAFALMQTKLWLERPRGGNWFGSASRLIGFQMLDMIFAFADPTAVWDCDII